MTIPFATETVEAGGPATPTPDAPPVLYLVEALEEDGHAVIELADQDNVAAQTRPLFGPSAQEIADLTHNTPVWMRQRSQWGVSRAKVSYRATDPGRRASSTDPATWSDFDTAVRAWATTRVRDVDPDAPADGADNAACDGIGYFLADDEFGADLDGCVDIARIREGSDGTLVRPLCRRPPPSSNASTRTPSTARPAPACT